MLATINKLILILSIWYFFRLLKSLEEADYDFEKNNPNWNIILEIRIDVGGGKKVAFKNSKNNQLNQIFKGDQVQQIAKKFKFSHGATKIHIEEEPR